MKSRNLNFLEPSGPLQVCNGTALQQFPLDIKLTRHDLGQVATRILSFYAIRILNAAVTQVWYWHHNSD